MSEKAAMEAIRKTLLQVARCNGVPTHPETGPCSTVLDAQGTRDANRRQVPEPWRGDIGVAPLLFVSSNPGWNPDDDSPVAADSDDAIVGYFAAGFPKEFPRNLMRTGRPNARSVAFWAAIRGRAAELYERPRASIIAGRDFALTEVVHCKSRDEKSLGAASAECFVRHFAPIARLSSARIVVVLGDVARDVLRLEKNERREMEWYGRRRWVVCLPHPNAHEPRTLDGLHRAGLAELRSALRDATAARDVEDPIDGLIDSE